MRELPVCEIPSNSHCSQFVLLIAGVILIELIGSDGDEENMLGPSKTSKAVLLLIVHELSSHLGVKSSSVGNSEEPRGTWYRFAAAKEERNAVSASVLSVVPPNIFDMVLDSS